MCVDLSAIGGMLPSFDASGEAMTYMWVAYGLLLCGLPVSLLSIRAATRRASLSLFAMLLLVSGSPYLLSLLFLTSAIVENLKLSALFYLPCFLAICFTSHFTGYFLGLRSAHDDRVRRQSWKVALVVSAGLTIMSVPFMLPAIK